MRTSTAEISKLRTLRTRRRLQAATRSKEPVTILIAKANLAKVESRKNDGGGHFQPAAADSAGE